MQGHAGPGTPQNSNPTLNYSADPNPTENRRSQPYRTPTRGGLSLEGRQLYDGGVVANVPLTQALAMGAQSLVVLDAVFPGHLPEAPSTLAEAMLFTAMVTMRMQAALEAPLVAAQVPVVYLPGPAIQRVSPLEFDHTNMLIDGGYQVAKPFLESLDVTGPGLYGRPWGR